MAREELNLGADGGTIWEMPKIEQRGIWPKAWIFDVPPNAGIPDAFSEMFRKNRKFFQPQLMTYQNPSNNITKPSAASVWPKSQLFDVPPNAGVLDPF